MLERGRMVLPRDVLDHLMQYVDRPELGECIRVSKGWQGPALARLWRRVDLDVSEWETLKPLFARAHKLAVDYRVFVRDLRIAAEASAAANPSASSTASNASSATGGIARFVAGIGAGLRVLCIEAPVISDDDLWAISSRCTSIHTLSLTSFSGEPSSPSLMGMGILSSSSLSRSGSLGQGRISDEGVISIVSHCQDLRHLRLRASGPTAPLISDRAFDAVAQHCGSLKSFALEWCGSLGSRTSNGSSMEDATRIANSICRVLEANPNLTVLSIDWNLYGSELDAVLQSACKYLVHLETFRVGGFSSLAQLAPLIQHNWKLKNLILIDMMSANITDTEIPDFFFDLEPSASSLVTTALPPAEYAPLSMRLKTLEVDGIGHILSTLPIVSRFTNLTRLKVSSSRFSASMAFERTDSLVGDAITHLPLLTYLEIPIVGNAPLFAIANSCPRLQEIDIVDGSQITDQALILLVKSCRELRHVHLGSAACLTDTSILVLARTISQSLLSLTLPFRAILLTFKVLDELQSQCPNIETLLNLPVLGGNLATSISKETLLATVPLMKRLRKLGLCFVGTGGMQGVFGIFMSRIEIDALKSACARLKIVVMNA
ncbi:hypothetical protein BC830DRAFT_1117298 [Chytriomyces sp. MP71]|nr:hypothetical protein BC830DRAFT_1117298 [Chytriomyces sp. MP71]